MPEARSPANPEQEKTTTMDPREPEGHGPLHPDGYRLAWSPNVFTIAITDYHVQEFEIPWKDIRDIIRRARPEGIDTQASSGSDVQPGTLTLDAEGYVLAWNPVGLRVRVLEYHADKLLLPWTMIRALLPDS